MIIKTLGNPVLREPCKDITSFENDTKRLADKLRFAMLKNPAYAVAAPQIGISKCMFVYSYKKDINKIIINPEIKEYSTELCIINEACLSIPGFTFPIERPKSISIKALSLSGDTIEIEVTDMLARVFQHEMDHLDAVLTIDHLSEEGLIEFQKQWQKRKKVK